MTRSDVDAIRLALTDARNRFFGDGLGQSRCDDALAALSRLVAAESVGGTPPDGPELCPACHSRFIRACGRDGCPRVRGTTETAQPSLQDPAGASLLEANAALTRSAIWNRDERWKAQARVGRLEEALRGLLNDLPAVRNAADWTRMASVRAAAALVRTGEEHGKQGEELDAPVPGASGTAQAPLTARQVRHVVSREEDHTVMWVETNGSAKAFAAQLVRDGKPFKCEPCTDEGWQFTVYETNHPNNWEDGA